MFPPPLWWGCGVDNFYLPHSGWLLVVISSTRTVEPVRTTTVHLPLPLLRFCEGRRCEGGGAGLFVFRAEPSNTTAETTKNRAHTTCFFQRDEGNSNGQNTMDRIWVFFTSFYIHDRHTQTCRNWSDGNFMSKKEQNCGVSKTETRENHNLARMIHVQYLLVYAM